MNDSRTEADDGTGRRVPMPVLDDLIALMVITFFLVLVWQVMNGSWAWNNLPDQLQYWTTSAFVVSLGWAFGKRVHKLRRS